MSKQSKELRSRTTNELRARMAELQKEQVKVNAQVATGTIPKNPYQIRNAKRTIARILTIQREQELKQALETVKKEEKAVKKPVKTGKEAKKV
ncbi:50S ribosomal protein L29 [Candidatus Woesearchaeota archaeon]|nr:50S ribosomal protein L29 [Candidatus Woesearchaeota archaeon]